MTKKKKRVAQWRWDLQKLHEIRDAVELGKIAARIYVPADMDRYSWTLRPFMHEIFVRTYWGSRKRLAPTQLPDWEELW